MSLFGVLRVLALLLGVELSGAGHLAADALCLAVPGLLEHEEERCPPNGPCDDCPPGCPQCHCPNVIASVPAPSPLALATTDVSKAPSLRIEEQPPTSPELPLPFRPPRTELAFS